MASLPHPTSLAEAAARKEMAERATRIAAMLERWRADDVSGEPDWDVKDIEPMKLRENAGPEPSRP